MIGGNTSLGIEIESDEQAIEDGWLPSFWDGENHHEVACPNCADKFLAVGEDGEIEVKPEYQGKIVYVDTDTSEHLLIGFAVLGGLSCEVISLLNLVLEIIR